MASLRSRIVVLLALLKGEQLSLFGGRRVAVKAHVRQTKKGPVQVKQHQATRTKGRRDPRYAITREHPDPVAEEPYTNPRHPRSLPVSWERVPITISKEDRKKADEWRGWQKRYGVATFKAGGTHIPVYRVVDDQELDLLAVMDAATVEGGTFASASERRAGSSWGRDPEQVLAFGEGHSHRLKGQKWLLATMANGQRFGQEDLHRHVEDGMFDMVAGATTDQGISLRPKVSRTYLFKVTPLGQVQYYGELYYEMLRRKGAIDDVGRERYEQGMRAERSAQTLMDEWRELTWTQQQNAKDRFIASVERIAARALPGSEARRTLAAIAGEAGRDDLWHDLQKARKVAVKQHVRTTRSGKVVTVKQHQATRAKSGKVAAVTSDYMAMPISDLFEIAYPRPTDKELHAAMVREPGMERVRTRYGTNKLVPGRSYVDRANPPDISLVRLVQDEREIQSAWLAMKTALSTTANVPLPGEAARGALDEWAGRTDAGLKKAYLKGFRGSARREHESYWSQDLPVLRNLIEWSGKLQAARAAIQAHPQASQARGIRSQLAAARVPYDRPNPRWATSGLAGWHWGSATEDNITAQMVALTSSGGKYRPLPDFEERKVEIGDPERVYRARLLRRYAQHRMATLPRADVPVLWRGMMVGDDVVARLQAGRPIPMTGATAFSARPDVGDQYSSSDWSRKVGSGSSPVVLEAVRDDALDASIGMFHLDKDNPHGPPFEVLSGAAAFVPESSRIERGVLRVRGRVAFKGADDLEIDGERVTELRKARKPSQKQLEAAGQLGMFGAPAGPAQRVVVKSHYRRTKTGKTVPVVQHVATRKTAGYAAPPTPATEATMVERDEETVEEVEAKPEAKPEILTDREGKVTGGRVVDGEIRADSVVAHEHYEAGTTDDETREWQFLVPARNVGRLKADLEKLEKKAAKLGGEPPQVVEVGHVDKEKVDEYGEKYTQRYYVFRVTETEPIKLKGYTFVATVEHLGADDEGVIQNVLKPSPVFEGGDLPKHFRHDPATCDHCHTRRDRRETFILQRDGDGSFKRVGRSCLKDFVKDRRADDVFRLRSYLQKLKDVLSDAEDEDGMGGGGRGGMSWKPWEVVLTAVQLVDQFGFVGYKRHTETGEDRTLTLAREILLNKGPAKPDDATAERARQVLRWARDIDPDTESDYLHNVRASLSQRRVGDGQLGVAVSVVSAYDRAMERRAKEAREAALPDSTPFLTVGAKFGTAAGRTIKLPKAAHSAFETDVLELAADPEGHGLSEQEARGYAALARGFEEKDGKATLTLPALAEDLEAAREVITAISNTYDDRAAAGEKVGRIPGTLATLSGKMIEKHPAVQAVIERKTTFTSQQWGPMDAYNFRLPTGEKLVWFTEAGGYGKPGDKVVLSGTVKRHQTDQRKGDAVTAITRAGILFETDPGRYVPGWKHQSWAARQERQRARVRSPVVKFADRHKLPVEKDNHTGQEGWYLAPLPGSGQFGSGQLNVGSARYLKAVENMTGGARPMTTWWKEIEVEAKRYAEQFGGTPSDIVASWMKGGEPAYEGSEVEPHHKVAAGYLKDVQYGRDGTAQAREVEIVEFLERVLG